MSESPWVTEKEASNQLGVEEATLQFWREIGYLRPGTHWRKFYEEYYPENSLETIHQIFKVDLLLKGEIVWVL